jgi:phosphoribosylformylglycinamidine cyclo-ligase
MWKLTYASAGVDIDAADRAKKQIATMAKSTFNEKVRTGIGLFAGAYDFDDRILLSSTDSVGTKIMIANMMGVLNTVGEDIVNHCANDIAVHNANPLFFLDYIAHSDFEPKQIISLVEGIVRGCKNAKIALIGGETAQLPGIYPSGMFDLAGFIVGEVKKDSLITGESISPGDVIIGLLSNGLHTNGYSLARKVLFDIGKFTVESYVDELGCTVGEALLATHTLYVPAVHKLRDKVSIHGMAHITGGGVPGNLIRVLPENCCAKIYPDNVTTPSIMKLIRRIGNIESHEMYRTFNMGFGYLIILSASELDIALEALTSFDAFCAGKITKGKKGKKGVEICR